MDEGGVEGAAGGAGVVEASVSALRGRDADAGFGLLSELKAATPLLVDSVVNASARLGKIDVRFMLRPAELGAILPVDWVARVSLRVGEPDMLVRPGLGAEAAMAGAR